MKTKAARIRQIEAARHKLRVFDSGRSEDRAILLLVLQDSFKAFVADYPGSLREIARRTELSVAFLSDVMHGRRKVSDALIEKLAKLR